MADEYARLDEEERKLAAMLDAAEARVTNFVPVCSREFLQKYFDMKRPRQNAIEDRAAIEGADLGAE